MTKPSILYSQAVIEFVKVAVQLCAALERAGGTERGAFISQMQLLVPMLYIKARTLPHLTALPSACLNITRVSEQDYDYVRAGVHTLLGPDDEYLAVAPREEGQTEETLWRTVSEALADVYQPVRNFLASYESGIEDNMREGLVEVADDFDTYWGASLAEVMAPLHKMK